MLSHGGRSHRLMGRKYRLKLMSCLPSPSLPAITGTEASLHIRPCQGSLYTPSSRVTSLLLLHLLPVAPAVPRPIVLTASPPQIFLTHPPGFPHRFLVINQLFQSYLSLGPDFLYLLVIISFFPSSRSLYLA